MWRCWKWLLSILTRRWIKSLTLLCSLLVRPVIWEEATVSACSSIWSPKHLNGLSLRCYSSLTIVTSTCASTISIKNLSSSSSIYCPSSCCNILVKMTWHWLAGITSWWRSSSCGGSSYQVTYSTLHPRYIVYMERITVSFTMYFCFNSHIAYLHDLNSSNISVKVYFVVIKLANFFNWSIIIKICIKAIFCQLKTDRVVACSNLSVS